MLGEFRKQEPKHKGGRPPETPYPADVVSPPTRKDLGLSEKEDARVQLLSTSRKKTRTPSKRSRWRMFELRRVGDRSIIVILEYRSLGVRRYGPGDSKAIAS